MPACSRNFRNNVHQGHTVLGYKMFNRGFLDIRADIAEALGKLDYFSDPQAFGKIGGAESHGYNL